ncbi:proline-rich proteoglycan 2-like [Haliotis rubra]|uniref:proline-rich proteoglycan 2-like n=1 Tax=Haliotis rubra TaxID=36100 RepID=UPI001EE50062|nr:proline-rich proteoglycan 2-like [Haliotis rubra]
MAGCYSIVYRRMKRYCYCYKSRLFLLLVGLAAVGVTVWSVREDNRTLHSALLSIKQHGQSAQLKYKFLDWRKDPSEKLLHFGSRKNRFTHPENQPPVQGQPNEALQPALPQMNQFEHQMQKFNPGQPKAVPDQDKPNWAPAVPNEQNLYHRQPEAGQDQREFNGAPQPALPQGQNNNPGQPNAAPNMGQLNMEPQLALPQGQNRNPVQPNVAPNMGQLNMEPQLAQPQGRIVILVNLMQLLTWAS